MIYFDIDVKELDVSTGGTGICKVILQEVVFSTLGMVTSEAEGRASSTENKILIMSGRGHAFERLISLEPKARLTSGLLWWVPPSLLPCMGPMPNRASTYCGTWRVPPGGCHQFSACCFSVTAGPIVLKFCIHLGPH